jgi:hypothetical protein
MTVGAASLATQAEETIRQRLPGIEGVSVRVEGTEVREIHILTSTDRPAKKLVRDVQTVLSAGMGLSIDHRVVSIVQSLPQAAERQGLRPEAAAAASPAVATAPEASADEEEGRRDERIRFESVNLFVSGPRTQVQVELRWRGLPRIGSASGWSTRDESHRLVAQATAAAVQEFLADPVAFNVTGVELVATGRLRVAVATLSILAHRQEKVLTGSCVIEQDTPQAVVLATLAALNRVAGGLRAKEPTEYVLRTTAD